MPHPAGCVTNNHLLAARELPATPLIRKISCLPPAVEKLIANAQVRKRIFFLHPSQPPVMLTSNLGLRQTYETDTDNGEVS